MGMAYLWQHCQISSDNWIAKSRDDCSSRTNSTSLYIILHAAIDVWEHAYYIDYKNIRLDYVKQIWKIINWKDVERRFLATIPKKWFENISHHQYGHIQSNLNPLWMATIPSV